VKFTYLEGAFESYLGCGKSLVKLSRDAERSLVSLILLKMQRAVSGNLLKEGGPVLPRQGTPLNLVKKKEGTSWK